METVRIEKSIRHWLIFFITALVLSGVTASPLETELRWLCAWWPDKTSTFYNWLNQCFLSIQDINGRYPFLAYGYDWLAFAHIVIAIAFIGPLKDPVRNIWVIESGRIACILIIPLALIAGQVRQIPFYWTLIDCSFGIIGIIPLTICVQKINMLEKLRHSPAVQESKLISSWYS